LSLCVRANKDVSLKKITYETATEQDRAFFIHVHHISYRDTIEKMFGWDKELQYSYANKAFDEGGILIIWVDGKKAGVIGWEDRAACIWLKEFFLLPEYQGLGIGTQVVQDMKIRAKSAQKDIHLRTLKANIRAKALYERVGFEVTDVTNIHWNMSLQLSNK